MRIKVEWIISPLPEWDEPVFEILFDKKKTVLSRFKTGHNVIKIVIVILSFTAISQSVFHRHLNDILIGYLRIRLRFRKCYPQSVSSFTLKFQIWVKMSDRGKHSSLLRNYCTRLKWPDSDNNSSLLQTVVNYGQTLGLVKLKLHSLTQDP